MIFAICFVGSILLLAFWACVCIGVDLHVFNNGGKELLDGIEDEISKIRVMDGDLLDTPNGYFAEHENIVLSLFGLKYYYCRFPRPPDGRSYIIIFSRRLNKMIEKKVSEFQ